MTHKRKWRTHGFRYQVSAVAALPLCVPRLHLLKRPSTPPLGHQCALPWSCILYPNCFSAVRWWFSLAFTVSVCQSRTDRVRFSKYLLIWRCCRAAAFRIPNPVVAPRRSSFTPCAFLVHRAPFSGLMCYPRISGVRHFSRMLTHTRVFSYWYIYDTRHLVCTVGMIAFVMYLVVPAIPGTLYLVPICSTNRGPRHTVTAAVLLSSMNAYSKTTTDNSLSLIIFIGTVFSCSTTSNPSSSRMLTTRAYDKSVPSSLVADRYYTITAHSRQQ